MSSSESLNRTVDRHCKCAGQEHPSRWGVVLGLCLAMITLAMPAGAFTLLGPYTDWMDVQKGYRFTHDIGGPMNIGEGYRWNMPVVTYGFDRSFLDYFGSNGVAAVEQAIAMLNALPPASSIVLSNYATNDVWRVNYQAQASHLTDLKSQTLNLLLGQMGLADSQRYTFCIRDFPPQITNSSGFQVITRNFDPLTLQPSFLVNNVRLTYQIYYVLPSAPTNLSCTTHIYQVDSLGPQYTAATTPLIGTGFSPYAPMGSVLIGLSEDDVGGLRYLLSGNLVQCESLLDDVKPVGTNTAGFVRTACRPGIEKVTFVRHPYGSLNGAFKPYTNRWTDIYYDWDLPVYQDVERITTNADIVFSARDFGVLPAFTVTGTTNWINNADLNDNEGGAGPGVIRPPITIAFNKSGQMLFNGYDSWFFDDGLTQDTAYTNTFWGSFNGSTNQPLRYPANIQISFQQTQVQLSLVVGGATNELTWPLAGSAYGRFVFQTAPDLTNWTTLAELTNSGAVFSYRFQAPPNETQRFFRTVSER